jgi:type 1 glutamine amidotransferase
MRYILAFLALGICAAAVSAGDQPKRVLLVTHSGGFMHDSIGVAEEVLKKIGPKYGLEFSCYRFTGDPDAMRAGGKTAFEEYADRYRKATGLTLKREECGRVNAETLKKFDAVLFFTTGDVNNKSNIPPLTADELKDLITWVKNGGAFAGTHCGSDTMYVTPYGELVGALFRIHPPGFQKIRVHVEDPKHPAAKGFKDGMEYLDEMYIFKDQPYNRDRLHIILSIYADSFDPKLKDNIKRADKDYAISWCQQFGKGRSFYTSLGHRKEVWRDEHFQQHLMGGLRWALGLEQGDATPTTKLKGSESK